MLDISFRPLASVGIVQSRKMRLSTLFPGLSRRVVRGECTASLCHQFLVNVFWNDIELRRRLTKRNDIFEAQVLANESDDFWWKHGGGCVSGSNSKIFWNENLTATLKQGRPPFWGSFLLSHFEAHPWGHTVLRTVISLSGH